VGKLCAYVDRRGTACTTAWCNNHGRSIDGTAYCRRHASTVKAVSADEVSGLPDVDNRAASLVSWVGDELDTRIQHALTSVSPERTKVITDRVRLHIAPKVFEGRQRRWVKVWKVSDHTGVNRTVSIEVYERDSVEVSARVDGRSVGQGVPPWIAHRDGNSSAHSDHEQRQDYYNGLVSSVSAGLRRDASHHTRTA
jgi:hypothetical protein